MTRISNQLLTNNFMADLRELGEKNVVTLDEERKATMVSNLMVVLCGDTQVHPVINTGTLYT